MSSRATVLPRPFHILSPAMLSLSIVYGLLSPVTAIGQDIPAKGSAITFEVATWNIEWFGGPNGPTDDARQVANVTEVIRQANIDLWALQEIADQDAFNTLVANLGGAYEGHIAPTSARQSLGLAFLYKPDIVGVRRIREILTAFTSDFAGRPPYEMEANLTLGGTTVQTTFIVVHMKATSDLDSYNKRLAASTRLKNHIDFTTLASEPVMVLGDLNDLLSGSITSGRESPYKNFVDDPNYSTPTGAFQFDGRNTFCGNSSSCTSGSAIDHIILSNEVEPWYSTGSADHFDELISEITSYVFTTSDHLPVFAAFNLTSTEVEDADLPTHLQVISTYPNPFRNRLTVEYSIAVSGEVSISLDDVLGRTARLADTGVRPAGQHRGVVDTAGLSPGLYVLRVSSARGSFFRAVIRL